MTTNMMFLQWFNVGPSGRHNELTYEVVGELYAVLEKSQRRAVEKVTEIYNTDFTKDWAKILLARNEESVNVLKSLVWELMDIKDGPNNGWSLNSLQVAGNISSTTWLNALRIAKENK